jgi:hypothetical protein
VLGVAMAAGRFVAVILGAVVVLSGCSGGGGPLPESEDASAAPSSEASSSEVSISEGPASETTLSAEEYVARADEICDDTAAEFVAGYEDGLPQTKKADQRLGKAFEALRTQRIEALTALAPPPELHSDVERYLALRQESADLLVERGKALANEDEKQAARLLRREERGEEQWQALGTTIGYQSCDGLVEGSDRDAAVATVERFFTGPPRQVCAQLGSEPYLDALGGAKACAKAVTQSSKVKVRPDITGTEGYLATAEVENTGDGKPVSVQLIVEDGRWKILNFSYV